MRDRIKRIARLVGAVLVWLLVFATAAVPAVFLNTVWGYLPVLLLAAMVLFSLLCLWRLSARLTVNTEFADVQCRRGQSVDIALELVNTSRLSCARAVARMYISDLFGGQSSTQEISFGVGGKGAVRFPLRMDMTHIGVYEVGLKAVKVSDFFGVFYRTVPVEGKFSAVVTPHIRPMDDLPSTEETSAEANYDTKVTVMGGTDYTGVREYAPGDPMKQIHWKLSAHSREYMTKLQESSRQQEFAIILDFAAEKIGDAELLMDLNDCLIETALSLLADIAEKDALYSLLYCDRSRNVARTVPEGRENDVELIRSFSPITAEPDPDYPDACQILQQEEQGQNRSTNVGVVTSRVTPELLQKLVSVKQQKRSPALFYIVPAGWNSRELEKAAAPLRQLEEAEVPYYIMSAGHDIWPYAVFDGMA